MKLHLHLGVVAGLCYSLEWDRRLEQRRNGHEKSEIMVTCLTVIVISYIIYHSADALTSTTVI